jgi:hypothetical protein
VAVFLGSKASCRCRARLFGKSAKDLAGNNFPDSGASKLWSALYGFRRRAKQALRSSRGNREAAMKAQAFIVRGAPNRGMTVICSHIQSLLSKKKNSEAKGENASEFQASRLGGPGFKLLGCGEDE